jgi:very-short-patch-repair endonuclease
MGKLIKYSIKWKLCEAKKRGNTREILYYTDKLKEVAIYMQGVQNERDEHARLKKKKPKKKVIKATTFIDPKVLALERRDKLIQNITRAEVYFKLLLTKLNIEYTFQYVKFVNDYQFYILDFYLPKYNICIELDGKHHYEDIEQYNHDVERDLNLKNLGIKTLRFQNKVAIRMLKEDLLKSIEAL